MEEGVFHCIYFLLDTKLIPSALLPLSDHTPHRHAYKLMSICLRAKIRMTAVVLPSPPVG